MSHLTSIWFTFADTTHLSGLLFAFRVINVAFQRLQAASFARNSTPASFYFWPFASFRPITISSFVSKRIPVSFLVSGFFVSSFCRFDLLLFSFAFFAFSMTYHSGQRFGFACDSDLRRRLSCCHVAAFFPHRALPVLVLRDISVFASQMARHLRFVVILLLTASFVVHVPAVTVCGCWLSTTHYAADCRPLRVSTPAIHMWQCRVAVDQGTFSGVSFVRGAIKRVESVQDVSFLRQLKRTRRPPLLHFRLPHVCFGTAPPHNTSSLHYRSDFQGFLEADHTELIIRDYHFRELAACKYARQSCMQTSHVRSLPLAFYWHAPEALISGTTSTLNQTLISLPIFLCYNLTRFFTPQCAISAMVRQALPCDSCRSLVRAGIRYRDTVAARVSHPHACHSGRTSSTVYIRSAGSFSLLTNEVMLPHIADFLPPSTACEYHLGCCSGSGFTAVWSFPPIPGQCLLSTPKRVTVHPPRLSALTSAHSWHLTVGGWTAEWHRCPISLRPCLYSQPSNFVVACQYCR